MINPNYYGPWGSVVGVVGQWGATILLSVRRKSRAPDRPLFRLKGLGLLYVPSLNSSTVRLEPWNPGTLNSTAREARDPVRTDPLETPQWQPPRQRPRRRQQSARTGG